MKRLLLQASVVALALMAFAVAPAFAYQEYATPGLKGADGTSGYVGVNPDVPSTTPIYGCPKCHGLESNTTSPTVGGRMGDNLESGYNVRARKGVHGGYTPGTQKCQNCHMVHNANKFGVALLPQPTIAATCFTCHDGTGGGGVYGVIKRRTGFDPWVDPTDATHTRRNGVLTQGGAHRIDILTAAGQSVIVPGGAADGSSLSTTYTGEFGSLTCTDCHSPHNSDTVKPFIGDRLRSINDSQPATPTNRLLRQKPTKAGTATVDYGSDWCEGCHKGRHSQASTMGNHPVADSVTGAGWNYSNVRKLTGFSTTSTTTGPLGGDNFGYVMPKPRSTQTKPICQQCHEDERNVSDVATYTLSPSEAFAPSLDGTSTTGNPRFQVFPHESELDRFLIEDYDDLCLNCHRK